MSIARRMLSRADRIVGIGPKSVSWIRDRSMQARGYGVFAEYDGKKKIAFSG